MGRVYINGREVIYRNCRGRAVAFPDVCFCPPGPPAGPIPVPLPNTVVAADLKGCAITVEICGEPAAHERSYFAKSTGNEASVGMGGGVISHATQGKAYFQTGSNDVLIEGKRAVRHGDLITCNHLSELPANTPPTPWMSSMQAPTARPGSSKRTLHEGQDFIVLRFVDEIGEPLGKGGYQVKTPDGRKLEGRLLHAGRLTLHLIAKGTCEVVLPDADARAKELGKHKAAPTTGNQKAYLPGTPLRLETGKEYVVVVPYTRSLWVDLPVRIDAADVRDDEIVLQSEDGSFRMVKTIADDRIPADRQWSLEFFGLEPGKSYTLTHHLGKDQPARTIFQDLPYDEIFPKDEPEKKQIEEPADFGLDPDAPPPRQDYPSDWLDDSDDDQPLMCADNCAQDDCNG